MTMEITLKPSRLVAALLVAPLCAFGYMTFFTLRIAFQEGFAITPALASLGFLWLFCVIVFTELEDGFTELNDQGIKQLRVRCRGSWLVLKILPWQQVTSYRLSGLVCELEGHDFDVRLNLASFNDWQQAKAFVERRLPLAVMKDALESQATATSKDKLAWWNKWRMPSAKEEITEEIGEINKVRRFIALLSATLGLALTLWMVIGAFDGKDPGWRLAAGIFFLMLECFWIASIIESYSVAMTEHGVCQTRLFHKGRATARPFLKWSDIDEFFADGRTVRLRADNLEVRLNFSVFRNWRNADLYVWNRLPPRVKNVPWLE